MRASIIKNKRREGKYKGLPVKALVLLFWLGCWQLAAMAVSQELLLAAPATVAATLLRLVGTADFWASIGYSVFRIMAGFFLALGLGCLLAALSYASPLVRILLSPLFTTIQATPVASFVILALVWISSRYLSIFTAFLMVLPMIYTNVLKGLTETDPKMLELVQVCQVPLSRQIRYIYFPAALPYFVSGSTVSLGLCWKAGVAAEVIGLPAQSIGLKLYYAKIYLNTPELFAWTLVIICISVVIQKVLVGLAGVLYRGGNP